MLYSERQVLIEGALKVDESAKAFGGNKPSAKLRRKLLQAKTDLELIAYCQQIGLKRKVTIDSLYNGTYTKRLIANALAFCE